MIRQALSAALAAITIVMAAAAVLQGLDYILELRAEAASCIGLKQFARQCYANPTAVLDFTCVETLPPERPHP